MLSPPIWDGVVRLLVLPEHMFCYEKQVQQGVRLILSGIASFVHGQTIHDDSCDSLGECLDTPGKRPSSNRAWHRPDWQTISEYQPIVATFTPLSSVVRDLRN